MKKIISTIATIAFVASSTFADITSKQVDIYLEKSGVENMLLNLQSQIDEMIDNQIKATGKTLDSKMTVSIKEVLSSDENIAKFTDGVKKLDLQIYSEIMAFYDTKEGKKGAEIAKNTDFATMQNEMMNFLQTQKETPFSTKKSLLIDEITKEINMTGMQKAMAESMIRTINTFMPKEVQVSDEQIDMAMTQMQPMVEQQVKISMDFNYKDFTEEELEKVLVYAKSDAGHTEAKIILDGTVQYIQSSIKEIMNAIITQLQSEHSETLKLAS